MKTILKILLISIALNINNAHSTVDYKIISIVNQNFSLGIDKQQQQQDTQIWSYQDLGSEEIIDIKQSSVLNIVPFTFSQAGRKFYLKDLKTKNILKIFHTIGINDKCEVFNNGAVLSKGQEINLICSVKVKKNLFENNNAIQLNDNKKNLSDFRNIDDPIINWYINEVTRDNKSNSSNNEFHALRPDRTNYIVELIDSHKNIVKYSSKISIKLPSDDESVWKMSNREISCQVTHENSYEIISKIKLPSLPVTSINCSYHLNINFSPFISQNVNTSQLINENQLSIIECPIKAPNFQPYKYLINWYYSNKDESRQMNDSWVFKYSKTFDKSGDLYIISNGKMDLDNGLYKCVLIDSVSGSAVLTSILNVGFNNKTSTGEEKSINIFMTTLGKIIINSVIILVLVIIIIFLAIKFKLNKKTMRVDVDSPPVNSMPNSNNQGNLKFELTNLQANRHQYSYEDDDDQVYKQNSVAISDDQSVLKRLAHLNTKDCLVHLASKLKHKKTCPMFVGNDVSFAETSISSVRTITQQTFKPIVQKSVHFNVKESVSDQVETDYESEFMESIYIHGYKN
jgi:hypothetical protein